MKFTEFISLPMEEQTRLMVKAGIKPSIAYFPDGGDFLDMLDLEEYNPYVYNYQTYPLDIDRFTYAKNEWYTKAGVKVSSDFIRLAYYIDKKVGINVIYRLTEDNRWFMDVPNIMTGIGHRKGYIDHSCGCSSRFEPQITDTFHMYNRFINEGKSIIDYQKWANDMYKQMHQIADELYPVYADYPKLYRSYAKVSVFRTGVFMDENPGLIQLNDIIPALISIRRIDSDISAFMVMVCYYALTMGEHGLQDETKVKRLLDILSQAGPSHPEWLDGITVKDFQDVYDHYMQTLPEFPYSNYLNKVNEEYYRLKGELREELMERYNVSKDAFNEFYSPENPCDEYSAFEC